MSPDTPLTFDEPLWLVGVLVVPLLMLCWAWAWRRRSAARRAFRDPAAPSRARILRTVVSLTRASLTAISIAALATALARPRTDPVPIESKTSGRDIVFVVDVSRSMLAQDLAPTRLDRAKLWIRDLAAARPSDRVALVGYAGVAQVLCPLTLDRLFFDQALDELSPRAVSRGGTMIGDAIRKAMDDVVVRANAGATDIILITDGEDQGSLPVEAAAAAGEEGARIIALGLGSPAGVTIPDPDGRGVIRSGGTAVRSALDADQLSSITAQTPGGAFLNVGTGTIRLDRVYADLTRGLETIEYQTTTTIVYREWFVWPLFIALVVLIAESVTPRLARA